MAFSRFSKPATQTAKAEPAPAPAPTAVVEAEVVGPETVEAPAPAPSRGLAKFGSLKNNVLAQVARDSERSSFSEPFPHILIKGGNSGGTLVPSATTEKQFPDIVAQLPQGKQPARGILVGYRAEAVAWPRNYDDKQEGEKPSINCAIPFTDADGIGLLVTGSENFQFAPREVKRSKWEAPNGGPGHLRPVFQMLVWLPGVEELVVLQCAPLLDTFRAQATQLNGLGVEEAAPVTCTVVTEPWYEDNVFHYWKVQTWLDAQAKATYQAFEKWRNTVMDTRPDVVQAVTEWLNGDDKPPSEQDIARLKQAANMGNPRRRKGE